MSSSISNFSEREAMMRMVLAVSFTVLMIGAGLAYHFFSPLSIRSQDNYLGTVIDLREKLENTRMGKPRILLVGGSSIGFSVSAEELTETFGVEVYNLGVNAGIGYRNIWENYRKFTDPENDLIVLSPTYSMFLRSSWYSQQLCDVIFLSKSLQFLLENPECFPTTVWRTNLDHQKSHSIAHNKAAIYTRSGHNQYGDVIRHLGKENREVNYRLATNFLKVKPWQVQKYITFVQDEIISRGYNVVVIPNLIPEKSCGEDQKVLQKIFTQLNTVNTRQYEDARWPEPKFCLPNSMFFDTAYHLNKTGRDQKTEIFRQWIKVAIGKSGLQE